MWYEFMCRPLVKEYKRIKLSYLYPCKRQVCIFGVSLLFQDFHGKSLWNSIPLLPLGRHTQHMTLLIAFQAFVIFLVLLHFFKRKLGLSFVSIILILIFLCGQNLRSIWHLHTLPFWFTRILPLWRFPSSLEVNLWGNNGMVNHNCSSLWPLWVHILTHLL